MSFDYNMHLKLPLLLNLQEPLSAPDKNDEIFFILVHQIHELLFKMLLHELDNIKECFCNNSICIAIEKWKRCRLILKTSISQFDTIETMTSHAFNQFRESLGGASGAQSYQFREIEFVLGYKRSELLKLYESNSVGHHALKKRLTSNSLIDCFYIFLEKNGAIISKKLFERDITLANINDKDIQDTLLVFYNEKQAFRLLFESMIDFDIVFSEWRFRHWKTVERIIGNKRGTGGTTDYQRLNESSEKMFFTDLWEIKNKL